MICYDNIIFKRDCLHFRGQSTGKKYTEACTLLQRISENDKTDSNRSTRTTGNRHGHIYEVDNNSWFSKNGLKSMCLNISHIMGKIEQVKLCLTEQVPDIFGLCDTFILPQTENRLLQHFNYTRERKNRLGQLGGGILCYVKDHNIQYERRHELENANLELMWL